MSTNESAWSYQDALDWLWSLVADPQGKRFLATKTTAVRRSEMEAQLARTVAFLDFIDRPQERYRTIHVTGTSGKGSVTTMIAHLLAQQGLSTAFHTSPYLQTPREKLVAAGNMISPSQFASVTAGLKGAVAAWEQAHPGKKPLKYGEAWVVLTFLWLDGIRPDWAVIEAGMGGRFDPTSASPAELAVITNVARDHVQSLGPTLTDIAWHKAGIIRPGRPAVTGITDPRLLTVLENEARDKGATLLALNRDFGWTWDTAGFVTVNAPFGTYRDVAVGPAGHFQLCNAALAITAIDVLLQGQLPAPVSLADCVVPGRLEVVSHRPLVILDGAHNPHKMTALVESLRLLYPERPVTALVGGIANKEVVLTLLPLAEICHKMISTRPAVPGKPAMSPTDIAAALTIERPQVPLAIEERPLEAIKAILAALGDHELLVITGSLYLVGQAREYWYPNVDH